jgi:hypothetical protein
MSGDGYAEGSNLSPGEFQVPLVNSPDYPPDHDKLWNTSYYAKDTGLASVASHPIFNKLPKIMVGGHTVSVMEARGILDAHQKAHAWSTVAMHVNGQEKCMVQLSMLRKSYENYRKYTHKAPMWTMAAELTPPAPSHAIMDWLVIEQGFPSGVVLHIKQVIPLASFPTGEGKYKVKGYGEFGGNYKKNFDTVIEL